MVGVSLYARTVGQSATVAAATATVTEASPLSTVTTVTVAAASTTVAVGLAPQPPPPVIELRSAGHAVDTLTVVGPTSKSLAQSATATASLTVVGSASSKSLPQSATAADGLSVNASKSLAQSATAADTLSVVTGMKLIMGAYSNTPDGGVSTSAKFQAYRATLGAGARVHRCFASGMPTVIDANYADDPAAGITFFYSVKPSYTSVGSDNASITTFANLLPAGSYLTAHHEPENSMTAAQFVAVFRNFYIVAKAANPDLYIGPSHLTYQWGVGRNVVTPDDWWVGADCCDFLGTDTYMFVWQGLGGAPRPLATDPDHQRWHNWAVTKGKPLLLTESGVDKDFTDQQRADYYLANESWLIDNGYRMMLPWNGYLTPGASTDFWGGSGSYPITVAAVTAINSRAQADTVLTP